MDFSHLNDHGNVNMVDVSNKPDQMRIAEAKGEIFVSKEVIEKIQKNKIAKGNVLTTAQIAGINATKKTSELIPLCHVLNITKADINFEITKSKIIAISTVKSFGKTGVEMEALSAVSIALLTIYDMCKAIDKNMKIGEIKLIKKEKH